MRCVHAHSLAVVVGVVLAFVGCREADRQMHAAAPSAPAVRSSTLFLAGDEEMWVVNAGAERADHLRTRGLLVAGDPPHKIAVIGDHLALWSYDVMSVPVADPAARPTTLAEDGWIFIPGAAQDRIWVGFSGPEGPPTLASFGRSTTAAR
jgi:hypothetical protein